MERNTQQIQLGIPLTPRMATAFGVTLLTNNFLFVEN